MRDRMKRDMCGFKPERMADIFKRNLSRGYTEGAENRRDTFPAAISFVSINIFYVHVEVELQQLND